MNNEHVNNINQQTVTRDLGWNFQTSQQIFINIANKKPRGQLSDFVPAFPLSDKRNYVVEEFSAEHQRAIISWDHYLTTKGEAGSGDSLPIFHRMQPAPYLV